MPANALLLVHVEKPPFDVSIAVSRVVRLEASVAIRSGLIVALRGAF